MYEYNQQGRGWVLKSCEYLSFIYKTPQKRYNKTIIKNNL